MVVWLSYLPVKKSRLSLIWLEHPVHINTKQQPFREKKTHTQNTQWNSWVWFFFILRTYDLPSSIEHSIELTTVELMISVPRARRSQRSLHRDLRIKLLHEVTCIGSSSDDSAARRDWITGAEQRLVETSSPSRLRDWDAEFKMEFEVSSGGGFQSWWRWRYRGQHRHHRLLARWLLANRK